MHRLNAYWILIVILCVSCYKKSTQNNDNKVIAQIYLNIPKYIPPFPTQNDSIKEKPQGINHIYALKNTYLTESIEYKKGTLFYRNRKCSLFEKVKIDSLDEQLVLKLTENNEGGYLDQSELKKITGEKLIFTESIESTEFDKSSEDFNRILSFSKPIYNQEKNRCTLYVLNYGSRMDSSLAIYILYKVNGVWTIEFRLPIQYS